MGFKVNRTYTLNFTGSDLEGAQIKLRAISVGTLMQIRDHIKAARAGDIDGSENALNKMLVDHIVEWDLEDDEGKVLDITLENLMRLQANFVALISEQWLLTAKGVPDPKG